jgi:hypothetical protein
VFIATSQKQGNPPFTGKSMDCGSNQPIESSNSVFFEFSADDFYGARALPFQQLHAGCIEVCVLVFLENFEHRVLNAYHPRR